MSLKININSGVNYNMKKKDIKYRQGRSKEKVNKNKIINMYIYIGIILAMLGFCMVVWLRC